MRTAFVETQTYADALNKCPWAAKIVKVYGVYLCFESVTDFQVWKNQK